MSRAEQIVQAVRDLAPTIRARSAEIEAPRRIPRSIDITHTLSQHASVAEGTLTRVGAVLIGQPVGFGF